MPTYAETERIVLESEGDPAQLSENEEKFSIYNWDCGNPPIKSKLRGKEEDRANRSEAKVIVNSAQPRITLGKPISPLLPVVLGGGVPILSISASTRVDPETKAIPPPHEIRFAQPLPGIERHEHQPYPIDAPPARHIKNLGRRVATTPVYHVYVAYSWRDYGLLERALFCLNALSIQCVAHYLPVESSTFRKLIKRKSVLPMRSTMKHILSPCSVVLLLADSLTEDSAFLRRIYEMETELAFSHGKTLLHVYTDKNKMNQNLQYHDFHCLLEPGPLQSSIHTIGHPAL